MSDRLICLSSPDERCPFNTSFGLDADQILPSGMSPQEIFLDSTSLGAPLFHSNCFATIDSDAEMSLSVFNGFQIAGRSCKNVVKFC